MLEGIQGGGSDAMRAFALVQEGRWSEAQTAFEAAIKLRQATIVSPSGSKPPAARSPCR